MISLLNDFWARAQARARVDGQNEWASAHALRRFALFAQLVCCDGRRVPMLRSQLTHIRFVQHIGRAKHRTTKNAKIDHMILVIV